MSHSAVLAKPIAGSSDRAGRAFFELFVLSLLVVSLPVKNVAYVVPPLYVLAHLLLFDDAFAIRTIILTAVVGTVSAVSILIDSGRCHDVNVPGLTMGLLTFMTLFVMLCERFDKPVDEVLFRKLQRVVACFVILQSAVGAWQFVMARGNPDSVAGTLGLLDWYYDTMTIGHVYFSFLTLGMVLFLMLKPDTWLIRAAIAAGLFACVLNQTGHQLVFFVLAFGLFALLQLRRLDVILVAGSVLAVVVALVLYVWPTTIYNVKEWHRKTVESPRSLKRMCVEGGIDILSNPKNLLMGTGVGQYCSRAALITSDQLLTVRLPSPPLVGQSAYYKQYIGPGMETFDEIGEGSAMSKPYFSFLSLVVEFGLLQFLALAAVFAVALGRNLRMMVSPVAPVARTGMLVNVGLAFFLLCCLVENYVEFPQALFIPFLLYMAACSRVRHCFVGEGSPGSSGKEA